MVFIRLDESFQIDFIVVGIFPADITIINIKFLSSNLIHHALEIANI